VKWKYQSKRPLVAAVTVTKGNVVFTGDLTGDFLALDARNGGVLYQFNTGGGIGGGVVTYRKLASSMWRSCPASRRRCG